MNIKFKKNKNQIHTWIRLFKFTYCIIIIKKNNGFIMIVKKRYKKNGSSCMKIRGELAWSLNNFIACNENKFTKISADKYNCLDRFFKEKQIIKELIVKANESFDTKLYFGL